MKQRVIVIHGTMGCPEENWFPWLKSELESDKCEVLVPSLPTPEGQSLENWLAVFACKAGALRASDILVGHSIGAAFVLRLLEYSASSIHAAFLVSGFARELGSDFDTYNRTFVEPAFDWERIRANVKIACMYNSDNDPYVPLALAEELSTMLHVSLNVIADGGHLNTAAGYLKFERLKQDIASVMCPEY